MSVFPAPARALFASHYPEVPHKLTHSLHQHPLLEIEALAGLAEALGTDMVEYNAANQPIGVEGKPAATGLPIGETIRTIEASNSWAVLKNIEAVPAYRDLLHALIDELRAPIEAATGALLNPQGFIFITSPHGVTPYHFDPEHNILLQVRGTKVMTQFPSADPRYSPATAHESYHTGGPRELKWRDEMLGGGSEFPLAPGEALFVPVMAPHFVRNGPAPSVSLSITWRSDWSYAESAAHAFNARLRRLGLGLEPRRPGRWPEQNRAKSYAWRAMQRLGLG